MDDNFGNHQCNQAKPKFSFRQDIPLFSLNESKLGATDRARGGERFGKFESETEGVPKKTFSPTLQLQNWQEKDFCDFGPADSPSQGQLALAGQLPLVPCRADRTEMTTGTVVSTKGS